MTAVSGATPAILEQDGTLDGAFMLQKINGSAYVLWQDAGEFTFTTDSVFVAAFAHLVKNGAGAGAWSAASGAISLFLAARGAEKVTGIEFNPKVTALMERSIKDNGLEETVKVIGGDLREINKYFKTESMDLVLLTLPTATAAISAKLALPPATR